MAMAVRDFFRDASLAIDGSMWRRRRRPSSGRPLIEQQVRPLIEQQVHACRITHGLGACIARAAVPSRLIVTMVVQSSPTLHLWSYRRRRQCCTVVLVVVAAVVVVGGVGGNAVGVNAVVVGVVVAVVVAVGGGAGGAPQPPSAPAQAQA